MAMTTEKMAKKIRERKGNVPNPPQAKKASEDNKKVEAPKQKESFALGLDKEEFAQAIAPLITTGIGGLFGGLEGGAAGAKVGAGFVSDVQKSREKKAEEQKRAQQQAAAIKAEEAKEQRREQFQLKKQERGFKQQETLEDKRLALTKAREGKKAGEQEFRQASQLRKERLGLPTTKDTQAVAAAYSKVKKAAEKPSAAGDLSLIFNYMKMLDPGSVVREGEFANAQNSAGIPDRIRNSYNRAIRGERLNPRQRNDFVGQSEKIFAAQLDVQDQVDSEFERLAKLNKLDPQQILVNVAPEFKDQIKEEIVNAPPEQQSSFLQQLFGMGGVQRAEAAAPLRAPEEMNDDELDAELFGGQ